MASLYPRPVTKKWGPSLLGNARRDECGFYGTRHVDGVDSMRIRGQWKMFRPRLSSRGVSVV
jgi:hypothetical protein